MICPHTGKASFGRCNCKGLVVNLSTCNGSLSSKRFLHSFCGFFKFWICWISTHQMAPISDWRRLSWCAWSWNCQKRPGKDGAKCGVGVSMCRLMQPGHEHLIQDMPILKMSIQMKTIGEKCDIMKWTIIYIYIYSIYIYCNYIHPTCCSFAIPMH